MIPILIVDDETDLLEMYQEYFEMAGFRPIVADSVKEGLIAFKNNRNIRLIISDFNMRDKSGIEFLKTLKSTYEEIPLFYLATGEISQTEDSIKLLGGTGVLLKPFDLDEILSRVKKDLNL